MKYILTSLTMMLALISGTALAQGNAEDIKIMSKLNAGEYTGKRFAIAAKRPLMILRSNGVAYKLSEKALKEINPGWIDEVQVIKEVEGAEKLSNEFKDGIVILTFKENNEAASNYLESVVRNGEKVAIRVPETIHIKE